MILDGNFERKDPTTIRDPQWNMCTHLLVVATQALRTAPITAGMDIIVGPTPTGDLVCLAIPGLPQHTFTSSSALSSDQQIDHEGRRWGLLAG